MKINKFKLGCLILFITGLLVSCSKDMLKENLYSQPGSTNVTGAAGATALTNGIYGYVQFFSYNAGNNWMLDVEANTDEFYCNWGNVDAVSWGGAQNFINMDAGHYQVQLKWNNVYKLIAQCNTVINKFSESTDVSIIQNVAQARFWRAFGYAKLYYVYGTVPLIKGSEDQSNGIARATSAEMESFIETELKAVETLLPASYNSSDYGRPTRWAVKAFLARFYLNTHNWQKGSDYAKDVITNGGFSLLPNYQDVFGVNGNNEVILAVNHVSVANRGNKYIALSMDAPIETALGITGVSASNGYGMATQFYNSFDKADKRMIPYNRATGQGIAIAGIIYGVDGKPAYGTVAAPQTVEANLHRIISCKWPVAQNITLGEDAPFNLPLLRLGESYLSYAEAQNELGNTANAIQYLNFIRNRAGLGNTTATAQSTIRTAILDERGWELYHEGYRREDLMRAGKTVFLAKIDVKAKFYLGTSLSWGRDTNRILQPLPTSELQLNRLLKQNPGY